MANKGNEPALLDQSHSEAEVPVSTPAAPGREGAAAGSGQPSSDTETPPPAAETQSRDSSSATPDSRPAAAPTRPTLVQLGSGSTSASTHHPPKKFNAVNINKKFLEKNSAAAAMATTSSASVASKASSSIARPQIQTTQSHSRLVAAKLTGSPAPSTTTGPGWSRPTSTAPSSTGTNSPIGTSPMPAHATALQVGSAAPQLPHVGKVIQPQPRAAVLQTANLSKEGGKAPAKPAWASVKPASGAPIMTSQEFPTAAEVAQASRKPKQDDQKSTPESASVMKHRLEEEADTFRGVHLDPNAHHWDEMEEDNDDFLDEVIEFGDGRQYKVEATEPSGSPIPGDDHPAMSKEDRFVDDFDRSWPKSKPSPASSTREFTASSPALSSRGASLHGGQDPAHPQLFNERSNRLEPYSHGPRSGQSSFQNRRGSHNDGSAGSIQLLQKYGNGELPPRPPRDRTNGAPSRGFPGSMSDRRDGGHRRDHPPPSPRLSRNEWPQHDMAPSTSLQGRDRDTERGRKSDMGPPPVPLHATRRLSQDSAGGRQLPPHLSHNMPISRRLPSSDRDSVRESRFGPAPTSPQSSRFAPPSPALSHASTLALSPGSAAIALPGGATADLNEVTKDLMQTAAARAKARKQQEEAEREAQKERARRKAQELEDMMKEKEKNEAEEKERKEEEEREKKEEERAKAKEREKEAVAFIESAVDGFKSPVQNRRPSIDATSLPKNLPRRPPSHRGQQRRTSEVTPGVSIPGARRPSFGVGTRTSPTDASPATQSESWRAKASPLPPFAPRYHQPRPPHSSSEQPPPSSSATPAAAPSTALDHVADIAEGSMNDLEVVDFANMGKFVGDEEEQKAQSEEKAVAEPEKAAEGGVKREEASNKPRPTASDFFDENSKPTSLPPKAENVWRRKTGAAASSESDEKSRVLVVKEETTLRASSSAPVVSSTAINASPPHPLPLHPRSRLHTEASMSALDDVMSRIKGAIDGMQASGAANKEERPSAGSAEMESHVQPHQHTGHHHHPPQRPSYPQPSTSTAKSTPHRERWQPAGPPHPHAPSASAYPTHQPPPSSRSRAEEKLEELRESLSTSSEPSHTPPPRSSGAVPVVLPKISSPIAPVPKRQQNMFSRPPFPARFELLSFEPPVQGMKQRDWSVNSVLFRQGTGFKANRIRVSLPPGSKGGYNGGARTVSIGPKYNIGGGAGGSGGFGKGGNADGATSWRKTAASTPAKIDEEKERAPDREKQGQKSSSKDGSEKHEQSEEQSGGGIQAKSRQQPKMPAGSAVAFMRDSKIDVVDADPKPLVNFIVTSELDEPAVEIFSAVSGLSESEKKVQGVKDASNDLGLGTKSGVPLSSLADGVKTGGEDSLSGHVHSSTSSPSAVSKLRVLEIKSSDESAMTPNSAPSPSHQTSSNSTPWGKPSFNVPIKDGGAVRAPDPELLKAVWSQPNKTDLNPVNSLEGIADDLTSVPFSVMDVKSEDGETPPPALPATTSRMSIQEVTKAFQKVPSSSPSNSSSQSRNPISPPSHNQTPAARASPYSYSPMPPNAMRSPYDHYSPMLSHSPSPTVIYPHQLASSPVPSRMPVNGHTPMYQAPVWITQQPAAGPGNPGAVMRPVMSPYPAHMMTPYGTPGTPVYGHPMGAMPTPQAPVGSSPAAAGRGRGVPMMSPAMGHAHAAPMYGSPVMMPLQPVPHHNHGSPYMSVPQSHNNTAHPAGRGQPRTDGPQNHHPQSQVGSGQQPHHPSYNPASFVRSTW